MEVISIRDLTEERGSQDGGRVTEGQWEEESQQREWRILWSGSAQ